jgi:hypothetical protein
VVGDDAQPRLHARQRRLDLEQGPEIGSVVQ